MEKYVFKKLVNSKIHEFWHNKLCHDASQRPSLQYLRPQFIPLNGKPHLIWESSSSSPSATRAAIIQAKLLSGRYRTDALCSKWSDSPPSCSLPGCDKSPADTFHLLSGECDALRGCLANNLLNGLNILSKMPQLFDIVTQALNYNPHQWISIVLDP